MRIRIAVVVAAGLSTLLTAPAQAGPHHGHDGVRYASIKACETKDAGPRPCGAWRLVMHDGSRRALPDAQTVALKANGKPSVTGVAPVAVSGDGQRLAYLTKSGRLAVRTLGGGVKLLAEDALPRVAQQDLTFRLSDDGGRLAVIDGNMRKGTRVFDTATGDLLGTIPGTERMMGFSGDGGEVLTSVDADESVTDLAVYSDTGEQLRRATPPQVVAWNSPQALSGDGRTVANMVMSGKPELVLYDMETDQVTSRTRVKLPAGSVHMIDWTGESQVTLHLLQERDDKAGLMTIVRIDTGTGTVKTRDRYAMLKDSYVFAACGG
ncbi:hypothetical protein [Nonomuraea sp. NPDC048916]|uniref:hypothetical protein n=1 Tax=Nonomuraea sp. NPDC048916 TaxID=3154232 RepID=UPI0033EA5887